MKYIVLLLFPLSLFSQTIKGKVYDTESTVKGIRVYNVSQKRLTYTNNEGDFSISASVNDTLFFESLFHHSKMVKLKQSDFDDIAIFELKKSVNELDEILLSDDKNKFNPLEYTQNAENALARDRKNNMQLYVPQSSYSNGMDFVAIAQMIGKLFKRKNKPKPIEFIEYKHLDSLFKKDDLFNLKLIKDDLNIPEAYAHLFLDYCDSKNLNKELISKENKVILLDSLVEFSKEFLKITHEFEASKDTLRLKN
ncbi:hypothetical protein [Jejuia pallidilutea]|uniref:Carboxypeptidase-like protein n=1 Tax=Jejuia pallidilutea TaxID=504487 RepID=A0A090W262_9FLAO|nr:hypothetical protein [Jejuia pallidilutea]PQV46260.1 hypothetical protein CLV33_11056 [Jejuia pallidilutea]GAL70981.1 hypothetical protein JCM19302_2936 [Jejuia pallidilutea]GAL90078.1 hypothetical protein JCM19538_819 [Jejuia pallidilutea]